MKKKKEELKEDEAEEEEGENRERRRRRVRTEKEVGGGRSEVGGERAGKELAQKDDLSLHRSLMEEKK